MYVGTIQRATSAIFRYYSQRIENALSFHTIEPNGQTQAMFTALAASGNLLAK